jgi:hypothetical protein
MSILPFLQRIYYTILEGAFNPPTLTENFNNLVQPKTLQISSLNPDKYSLSPSYDDAYNNLALTLRFLGKPEEVRVVGADILNTNPKFSVEGFAEKIPYKNKAYSDLLISGLQKAGLK